MFDAAVQIISIFGFLLILMTGAVVLWSIVLYLSIRGKLPNIEEIHKRPNGPEATRQDNTSSRGESDRT